MRKVFFRFSLMIAVALAAIITGCSKDDDTKPSYNPIIDDPKEQPVDNPRRRAYRRP